MEANAWLMPTTHTRNYVWSMFAAQWKHTGRTESTVISMIDNFVRFRVDPWKIDEARDRVGEYALLNGLRRHARMVLPEERVFVRAICRYPLPWVESERPDDHRESEYQSMWALLCITGNRPHDVFLAIIRQVGREGVTVHWVSRKVHSGVTETYSFRWCAQPPPWILNRWRVLTDHPWRFDSADNMASNINAWLQRKGSQLSSSSPRERLDRDLREAVERGEISQARYELLVDHKYSTALAHYNAAPIVEC